MLLKLIECDVADTQRARFSTAQLAWSAMKSVSGFGGQLGGWCSSQPEKAIIIGLWSGQETYDRFMADVHDDIFQSNRQSETCAAMSVSFWQQAMDISGKHESMSSAAAAAGFLRIARCDVVPKFRQQFFDVQRDLWNPAMASAGMLAGVFCENPTVASQMLVCTLWPSEAIHKQYVERDLPELRRRAQIKQTCVSIMGCLVALDQTWTVQPAGT